MVVVSDGPANISEHDNENAEDCEDEPEIGIVNSAVPLGQKEDDKVVEGAGKKHSEGDPNEACQVCEALVVNSVSGEEVSWGHDSEAVRGGKFGRVTHILGRVEAVLEGEDRGCAQRDHVCPIHMSEFPGRGGSTGGARTY